MRDRAGKKMDLAYTDNNRIGDHIWYISDTRKFQSHFPAWKQIYDLPRIVDEIFRINVRPGLASSPTPDACLCLGRF